MGTLKLMTIQFDSCMLLLLRVLLLLLLLYMLVREYVIFCYNTKGHIVICYVFSTDETGSLLWKGFFFFLLHWLLVCCTKPNWICTPTVLVFLSVYRSRSTTFGKKKKRGRVFDHSAQASVFPLLSSSASRFFLYQKSIIMGL